MIIRNDEESAQKTNGDTLIQMTAEDPDFDTLIRIPSYFVSFNQGIALEKQILKVVQTKKVPVVTIITEPIRNSIQLSPLMRLRFMLADILSLALLSIVIGSFLMTMALLLNGFHNYLVHGIFTVEDIDEYVQIPKPGLTDIPFEAQEITPEKIQGSIDCCAICIDEFKVKDSVRVLPCHHIFHCTW